MKTTEEAIPLDGMKLLIDKAVATGRNFLSRQTHFVHYFHSVHPPGIHQTIPLYENVLFALSLLRSRLIENIQEAKQLLHRLLPFQILGDERHHGGFPHYLHEFPHHSHPENSLKMIAPFYWILNQFSSVLGAELKQAVEKCLSALFVYCERFHSEVSFPYSLEIRLRCSMIAYGGLQRLPDLLERGEKGLSELKPENFHDSWLSTTYLTDLLMGIQMIDPHFEQLRWGRLWDFIEHTWCSSAESYAGPCIREWYQGKSLQKSGYDYYMHYLSNRNIPHRCVDEIDSLQAALIQPCRKKFNATAPQSEYKGSFHDLHWTLLKSERWCCTLLEKHELGNPTSERTLTPFRLLADQTSVVCQGGNILTHSFQTHEEFVDLYFELPALTSMENREAQREVSFFLTQISGMKILMDGVASSTFRFGSLLFVDYPDGKQVSFTFELTEGEGDFMGHLAKGDRPSQVVLQGNKLSPGYDFILFLRTIRRSDRCKIRVRVSYK